MVPCKLGVHLDLGRRLIDHPTIWWNDLRQPHSQIGIKWNWTTQPSRSRSQTRYWSWPRTQLGPIHLLFHLFACCAKYRSVGGGRETFGFHSEQKSRILSRCGIVASRLGQRIASYPEHHHQGGGRFAAMLARVRQLRLESVHDLPGFLVVGCSRHNHCSLLCAHSLDHLE